MTGETTSRNYSGQYWVRALVPHRGHRKNARFTMPAAAAKRAARQGLVELGEHIMVEATPGSPVPGEIDERAAGAHEHRMASAPQNRMDPAPVAPSKRPSRPRRGRPPKKS